jgi:hypothetical protein
VSTLADLLYRGTAVFAADCRTLLFLLFSPMSFRPHMPRRPLQ